MSPEPAPLTDEQQRLLQHEAFIKAVQEFRHKPPPAESPKPPWERFLSTTGGAALITVLLGGAAGQIIACGVQRSAKEREFQQGWLQARGNQAMVAYKEYLDAEQAVVKDAYESAGALVSASDSLLRLSNPDFDLSRFEGEERVAVSKQRKDVREEFNRRDGAWQAKHEVLGLLMAFYHPGQKTVTDTWRTLVQAVDAYRRCAQQWHDGHATASGSAAPCATEKSALMTSVDGVSAALQASRKYAWEGWESPAEMQRALEGKGK